MSSSKIKNTQDLLNHVFDQMDKLSEGDITVQQAREQSNLVKQANNILRYELDRVQTAIRLQEHEEMYGTKLGLREIESKPIQTIAIHDKGE